MAGGNTNNKSDECITPSSLSNPLQRHAFILYALISMVISTFFLATPSNFLDDDRSLIHYMYVRIYTIVMN